MIFNNYLNKEYYGSIVNTWNKTKANYPDILVHELFEQQVEKTPNNIAVIHQLDKLTYKEINKKYTFELFYNLRLNKSRYF